MGLPTGQRDGLRVSNSGSYVSGAGPGERSPGLAARSSCFGSIILGMSSSKRPSRNPSRLRHALDYTGAKDHDVKLA